MKLFKSKKTAIGMEIFDGGFRAGLFSRKNSGYCLEKGVTSPMPEDVLKISFKTQNILDPEAFKKNVKKGLNLCRFKGGRLGICLPHETVKLTIHCFQELPEEIPEIDALVRWSVTRKLAFPAQDMAISWTSMGRDARRGQVLLVAMMSQLVLAQYRKEIQSIGAVPMGFSPAVMNRFNLYVSALPVTGSCLYLALSKWVVTLAGFTEGVPLFFKTFRKGFLHGGMDRHGRDVSLMLDHCFMNCPGILFSRVFVDLHGVKVKNLEVLLREKGIGHVTILNPLDFIDLGAQFFDTDEASLFTATATAAFV
ncbi:hypothetical protein [Desulfocicer niacini]